MLCGLTLLCGFLSLAPLCSVAESSLSAVDAERFRMLLTDTDLWGQDALAFFASSQRWIDAGEHSALVFHDRVVAGRKLEPAAAGEPSAYLMAGAIPGIERKLRPEFKSVYQSNVARAAAFQIQAQRFLDDDSVRLTVQRPGGEFLKQGLTIRKIQDRYGKPDKTSTEVVQAQGDRRPAVLTIYSYAAGGVKFVMSDLSPTPETIDRVVIDVGTVASQLF
jgi:hypothetical protein